MNEPRATHRCCLPRSVVTTTVTMVAVAIVAVTMAAVAMVLSATVAVAMATRLPSVADRDGEYYLRQEGNGT